MVAVVAVQMLDQPRLALLAARIMVAKAEQAPQERQAEPEVRVLQRTVQARRGAMGRVAAAGAIRPSTARLPARARKAAQVRNGQQPMSVLVVAAADLEVVHQARQQVAQLESVARVVFMAVAVRVLLIWAQGQPEMAALEQ